MVYFFLFLREGQVLDCGAEKFTFAMYVPFHTATPRPLFFFLLIHSPPGRDVLDVACA